MHFSEARTGLLTNVQGRGCRPYLFLFHMFLLSSYCIFRRGLVFLCCYYICSISGRNEQLLSSTSIEHYWGHLDQQSWDSQLLRNEWTVCSNLFLPSPRSFTLFFGSIFQLQPLMAYTVHTLEWGQGQGELQAPQRRWNGGEKVIARPSCVLGGIELRAHFNHVR